MKNLNNEGALVAQDRRLLFLHMRNQNSFRNKFLDIKKENLFSVFLLLVLRCGRNVMRLHTRLAESYRGIQLAAKCNRHHPCFVN